MHSNYELRPINQSFFITNLLEHTASNHSIQTEKLKKQPSNRQVYVPFGGVGVGGLGWLGGWVGGVFCFLLFVFTARVHNNDKDFLTPPIFMSIVHAPPFLTKHISFGAVGHF